MLEENQSAKYWSLELRLTIQQDTSLKHVAEAELERFKSKNLHWLEWPSQSPDFYAPCPLIHVDILDITKKKNPVKSISRL